MVLRGKHDPQRMAELVATFARDMGGIWVRMASFLSDHRFTFPEEFCQVLLESGERTDGFPFEVVRRVVEEDLGRPLEEIFETFDHNPIAATFSSQTHKARLRAGRAMVAVKVQRPGITETIVTDLRIVRRLLPLLCRLTRIPRTNWADGLWRIGSTITLEQDYRLEATHMTRLGNRLRKHKVLVPWVYLEYSGKRTLTKQFVVGVTVAEFVRARKEDRGRAEQWQLENDIQAEKIGQRLFDSLMRQVLEEELFDQDWNPRNVLLLKGNRLALVDFWAMRALEKNFQAKIGTLFQAIVQREFRKAADYFILIGPPVPMTHDASEVRRKIVHSLRTFDVRARAELLPYEEKTLMKAFGEMGRAMCADGSSPTFDFLEVDRAFRVLDLSLRDLVPHANVVRMHEKFWKEADVRRLAKTLSRKSLRRSLMSAVELIAKSPETLAEQLEFSGELIRRQAKIFRQTSSKLAQLLESLFSLLTKGLLAMAVLLLAAFGFRRFHDSLPDLSWIGPSGLRLLERLPVADTVEGAALLLLVLYLAQESWKLKRRLGRKTLSRPNGSD
jgi:ubiquinone biosynthesis protein